MENQHRKIKGYKELSQEQIDMMNKIKEQGIVLGELVEEIQASSHLSPDLRWVAIGKTDLQQGLMALTRAVTVPDFF